jgi:hypothetical protein
MTLSRSGGHFYLAESGHLYPALIRVLRITDLMVRRTGCSAGPSNNEQICL